MVLALSGGRNKSGCTGELKPKFVSTRGGVMFSRLTVLIAPPEVVLSHIFDIIIKLQEYDKYHVIMIFVNKSK